MRLFFEETRQVDAEVSQREIGDGNTATQVFEINNGILKLEELLAAIFQVVHLVTGLLFNDVLLASGGDVEEHHAPADALFEVDVFLQLDIGPEVYQLAAAVRRTDAVNPPEELDVEVWRRDEGRWRLARGASLPKTTATAP